MDLTGIGSIADLAKTIIEKILPAKLSGAEQAEFQLKLQDLLESRERAVIEFQKSVIVAEMQQADNYTKRARPTIVYAGLFFILMVYVVFPMLTFVFAEKMPDLKLPEEFWWAWSGVCGIWVVGRSFEKQGSTNKLLNLITGGK